jgi:hypothetical protein
MSRRFRAPKGNGEILADPPFAAVEELARRNRELLDTADVVIDGCRLREFRRATRLELVQDDRPVFATGHQPELFHPGVWAKNFSLNGLARRLNAVPLNLIVDNDLLKSPHIVAPTIQDPLPDEGPELIRLEKAPFDHFAGQVPWEMATVHCPEYICQIPIAIPPREVFETIRTRKGALPEESFFAGMTPDQENDWRWRSETWHRSISNLKGEPWSEIFSLIRQHTERRWGCENLELPVSALSQSTAFRRFAAHIAASLPRFRTAYNRAVAEYRTAHGIKSKSHPVPDLAEGELPFWEFTDTGRVRATPATPPERLRPRALTLTLFVRLCLADWFIHGIGGGKYDEVTDAVIRDFFGLEPPAFQVVTGTLHLPTPGFPRTQREVAELEAKLRRLHWNPEGFLPADHPARLEKAALAASKPNGRPAVRTWFARIRELTAEMRAAVANQMAETERDLATARAEAAANAILKRRDFAWVLYPEDTLRPFLQQFLDV